MSGLFSPYSQVPDTRNSTFLEKAVNFLSVPCCKLYEGKIDVLYFRSLCLSNHQEYRVYSYFRQSWKDPRLAGKFNSTFTIKGGEIENLWVPDPYCYNARESNMMMPNEEIHTFVRIEPSGDLLYSKG